MKTFITWISVLLLAMTLNASVPHNALKAEMDGRWLDAAKTYEEVLKNDSSRTDLSLRLSDVYSKLKMYDDASRVLLIALKNNPNDAKTHSKLATVYSVNNQPKKAVEAVKKAVALEPKNMEYLRNQASLANWVGDYKLAVDSYKEVFEQTKEHPLLLQIARTNAWSGHLDVAAENFKNYLQEHPEEKEIYIDYARTEIWRGDYQSAKDILDAYVKRFSNDDMSQTLYADLYSRAEWPNKSHSLYEPLLEENPNDYMLNYLKTLALHYDKQVDASIESLQKVKSLDSTSKDTLDLSKVVQTPFRSNIGASGLYFQDIDDIRHTEVSLYGEYFVNPKTSLYTKVIYDNLLAKNDSYYKNIDGTSNIDITTVGVGATHRVNEYAKVDLFLGDARTENKAILVGNLNIRADLGDKNTLFLKASKDFYKISPRSVSIGVQRAHASALLEYRPTLEDTILLQGEYELFSSQNNKWGAIVAPRRAFVRTENWGVDFGVKAWLFGFDKKLNQGYYDPELFESYMLTIHSIYRFSSENEVSLIGGLGIIKDDTMDDYQPGMNLDLVGTMGIYKDWKFQMKTGYMNNQREIWSEYYDAYYLGASIMRRF